MTNKHLNHPITIIDKEVVVNTGLLHPGLIHAGRIMCTKCNVQIKWASKEDIDYYRNSNTKLQDTSSMANFNARKSYSLHGDSIKHMQDQYHKKYTNPKTGTYNIYLNVKFSEKDEVKKLGAKWDQEKKKWFTNSSNPKVLKLTKWMNSKDVDKLMTT
jgi:hypothetical protein